MTPHPRTGRVLGSNPEMSRGVTLVELLVVLSIIAILLSLTLPMLAKMRETSRDTTCKQQVRTVTQGVIGYTLERNRLPEVPQLTTWAVPVPITEEPATIMAILHSHIGPWIDPATDPVLDSFTQPFSCPLDALGFWRATGVSYVYTPSTSPFITARTYDLYPMMDLYRDWKAQTNGVLNVGRVDGSVTGE